MTTGDWITIATFLLYILGVFVLAGLSHRILSKKSFVSEYFLGSRGLGSWALAFTFAATSASGGSFTGFPSLIYTHGWILAFWIGSYMIVPMCTMGVLGKRLNQVARKTGAITIPDVLRDRYRSTGLALFATCTIIFFTTSNLVAQFKAGAVILQNTFHMNDWWGMGSDTAYLIALVLFAIVVIFYTAYGGFRAVVWTDVMQGVVMGAGVIILLPVILSVAGGLKNATEKIRDQDPLVVTSVKGDHNDLAFLLREKDREKRVLAGIEYVVNDTNELSIDWHQSTPEKPWMMQVKLAFDAKSQQVTTTANDIRQAVESHPEFGAMIDIEDAFENEGTGIWEDAKPGAKKHWMFIRGDEFLFGPGPTNTGMPFHPLGMGISFFFMWSISGMGQPGTMVRLMAFKESRTLKRAILTVTCYFALIYIPLVLVFVTARTLLPYIPQERADDAMVLVATRVIGELSWAHAILAAIFVAAPFAAVMSTVDSFLLITSSSCVRDIYQRTINPKVSERAIKIGSYATTVIVGIIVTALTAQRPMFLQYIIVFTGGGFAATFLAPVFLGIYWKGMTREGALAAMIGGFAIVVGLFLPTMLGGARINLFGFHPIFWGLSGSFLLGVIVSKLTGPPPQDLIDFYFRREVLPSRNASE